jgi:hypothetical protein
VALMSSRASDLSASTAPLTMACTASPSNARAKLGSRCLAAVLTWSRRQAGSGFVARRTEVDSDTGTEMQSRLVQSGSEAPDAGPVARRKPRKRSRNAGGDHRVQAAESAAERTGAGRALVLTDVYRLRWSHLSYHRSMSADPELLLRLPAKVGARPGTFNL